MLFERQRLLLVLVEALGERVTNTDLQKYLFLFTKSNQTTNPLYDFVPYRFGAFSFSSYADLRKLEERNLMRQDEGTWQISDGGRALIERERGLRDQVLSFLSSAPKLRGDALVALTYRLHPFFAVRSEIVNRVLGDDAVARSQIEAARPKPASPGISTIGYEGRSLEAYLVLLLKGGATILCDVRRNPLSRRYGFSKSTLSNACNNVGIRYEHLPKLGIASEERQGLDSLEDYEALFDTYAAEQLPNQTESLSVISSWVKDGHRVALTCFERSPSQCHRHCVADALLTQHGVQFAPHHL